MTRIPVEVIASFRTDGFIRPLYLIWEDGRKYEIDRLIDVQHRYGWKYLVEIKGERRTLYLEEKKFQMGMSACWYIESMRN